MNGERTYPTGPGVEGATIVTLERAGWSALLTDAGWRFYDELMTMNALMVFDFATLRREEAISALRVSPPWSSYHLEDMQIVELDGQAMTIVYRVWAGRSGNCYEAAVSSTYVRDATEWKLAFHQQTPVRSARLPEDANDAELSWIPEHARSHLQLTENWVPDVARRGS